MFLVEKTHLTSPFKLTSKKPSKNYQLAAKNFDEKVIIHLKTLDLASEASDSSVISLNWMCKAVTLLSTVHVEAQDQVYQISNLRSESDYYHNLYMDYSQKVLDLLNLVSSAVKQFVERRLLLNLSLRLIKSSGDGQISSPEKLNKAKDALNRSVHVHHKQDEKPQRAKDLLEELSDVISNIPIGKVNNARDLIRHTLHGLGTITVFVNSVLVSVLYGQSDLVEVRFPAEFRWVDSVTGVQKRVFDLKKPKRLLEVEDAATRAVAVCDVIDEVAADGDGDGGDERRSRLEDGVKELREAVEKFSDGVDMLTNGVNGLFSCVMKTRNGVLDGVRKGEW
ncbi:hypothetical protein Hdeb2414_s0009g00326271 [Helianthus debilis subsp. tardiflorus]